jgi:hypothetical protein
MPDDDRFSRYLTPAWRKVLRSLQGRDPAERVAERLGPSEMTRLYRAYLQEWEAVGPIFGLQRHDRSAA